MNKLFTLLLIGAGFYSSLYAQTTVTFDNGGGDNRMVNPLNWSTDQLPTTTNGLTGELDTNAQSPDSNASESLSNWDLTITTGANVSQDGLGRTIINNSTILMDDGNWNTRATRMDNTNFTLTGGTMSYNNRDGNFTGGTVFTVNGSGAVYDPNQSMALADATFNLEQGTVTDFNLTINNAASALNVNGGSFTATTLNTSAGTITLGGSTTGTFTASNFTAGSDINWISGSLIDMTINGTTDWAETEWNAGRLQIDSTNSGSWADATDSSVGVNGNYFVFDDGSNTLSLAVVPEPSTFALMGLAGLAALFFRRRK